METETVSLERLYHDHNNRDYHQHGRDFVSDTEKPLRFGITVVQEFLAPAAQGAMKTRQAQHSQQFYVHPAFMPVHHARG